MLGVLFLGRMEGNRTGSALLSCNVRYTLAGLVMTPVRCQFCQFVHTVYYNDVLYIFCSFWTLAVWAHYIFSRGKSKSAAEVSAPSSLMKCILATASQNGQTVLLLLFSHFSSEGLLR